MIYFQNYTALEHFSSKSEIKKKQTKNKQTKKHLFLYIIQKFYGLSHLFWFMCIFPLLVKVIIVVCLFCFCLFVFYMQLFIIGIPFHPFQKLLKHTQLPCSLLTIRASSPPRCWISETLCQIYIFHFDFIFTFKSHLK